MYTVQVANLPLDSVIVLIIATSFITYCIFKRFEPPRPTLVGLLLIVIPSFLVPALHLHVPSLFLSVAITFTSYYCLILLYVAIYRLSPFHPLAKFPGPIQNKLSKFTTSYIVSTGTQHTYFNQLHQRYGDIVRTGPNELSVNCVDTVHPILGAGGLQKGHYWSNRDPGGHLPSLLTTIDPVQHKQRRRTWDRAFSTAAIRNYDEIIIRKTRELLDQFEKRAGQQIDFSMWMRHFSFDFMGDMAFGTRFDMMQTGGDSRGIWDKLEAATALVTIMAQTPWLFTYLRFIPGAAKIRTHAFAISEEYVNHRVEQGSNIKDLFYYLTDEEGVEPKRPSMPTVQSDGLLAVVAGSDTVATALTVLWYYFLRNPLVYSRLRDEVDAYFPSGEEPLNFTRMVNMPYLNACINEALRLLPPVMSGSPRCVKSGSNGMMVGPYFIPEGSQVFNHTYTLQRNPRYFSPLPNSFWPDRWLPEQDRHKISSHEEFILNPTAFQPFSFGPASCVGKNLALAELRAVTCFIIQRFDFKPKDGFRMESWEKGVKDYFVAMRPALPVVVEVRR